MISRKIKIFTLLIVCFICFFIGLSWTILPSISNILISTNYHIDESKYAILSFSLVFAAIIFANIGGFLGKKWEMKKVIFIGLIFCFVGLIFFIISYFFDQHIYYLLFLAQFLLGMGISFLLSSITAYLSILFPAMSAMALTGIFACINLGSISGPIFFNILKLKQWWINLSIISFFWILLFFISITFFPSIKNPYSKVDKNQKIFKRKFLLFWVFFSVLVLFSICEYTYAFWSVVYLNKIQGFDISISRYALSIFWTAVAVGQITICWLLKYLKPKYFYRALPMFLFLGFWIMYFTNAFLSNIFGLIIGGFGVSAFVAITLSLVEFSFKEIAEITAGIMLSGYFLGYILGSLFISKSINFISLAKIFLFVGIIALIIEILTFYLIKKTHQLKKDH